MKDEFQMYGGGIKAVKSSSTRWIYHRIHVMQHFFFYQSTIITFLQTKTNNKNLKNL